jgi:hypothetical protein
VLTPLFGLGPLLAGFVYIYPVCVASELFNRSFLNGIRQLRRVPRGIN